MAFTQDELQSLNMIIEQKLSIQRHDLEQSFEHRTQTLKRDFEQHVTALQHDLLRTMSMRMNDQHTKTVDTLLQRIDSQPSRTMQAIEQKFEIQNEQQSRSYKDTLENSLAAQLLAFEEIINQRIPASGLQNDLSLAYTADGQSEFEAIEVQTEIPWEELAEMVDRALEERLITLKDSFISSLQTIEQEILQQMQALHTTLVQISSTFHASSTISTIETPAAATTQDMLQSIDHIEHLMESMQVAMTSNTSLISNRLYHHQQLPLERAHPTNISQRPEALSKTKQPIPYSEDVNTQALPPENSENEA
jgi:hypothetical protein